MTVTIDYFYTLLSSYTYLGTPRLKAIAERTGAFIRHRPVDLMAVFEAVGTPPPPKQPPARRAYRRQDLARWSQRLDMPINLQPKFWPVPPEKASCALLAAEAAGADPTGLSFAFLRAVWAEDRDISDEATITAILAENGLDAAKILDAAQAYKETFAANTREAIARGVIGAPTYFIGEDMFWGQDRLDFVEEACRSGNPA